MLWWHGSRGGLLSRFPGSTAHRSRDGLLVDLPVEVRNFSTVGMIHIGDRLNSSWLDIVRGRLAAGC
jgi:hypothetical protein